MSKTGYIYIIENTVNDEVYIGATTKSVDQRFKQHIYDSKNPTTYFHKFMNETGKDNFFIKVMKEVHFDDIFELLEAENTCIKNYGTLNTRNNYEYYKNNTNMCGTKQPKVFSVCRFVELSEKECVENALAYDEVLTYEKFLYLFLDENTVNVINYINSNDVITVNSLLLDWLGYEEDMQRYAFVKMLMRNNIPFEYSYEGCDKDKKRKILTMNSADFKHVALLKTKNSNIRIYFLLLEKLVKFYTTYLHLKLNN